MVSDWEETCEMMGWGISDDIDWGGWDDDADDYEINRDKYKTISEWNSAGRIIKKGEKGIRLSPRYKLYLFTKSQTVPFNLFYISKKNGKFRRIFSLFKEQKNELRQLIPKLEKTLSKLDKNKVNYGFVPNRNCVQHAMQHIGYRYTVSMDLKNFFESVKPKHINRYVSNEIIERCFISGAPQQGLPTSPIIANLAFLECDQKILNGLQEYDIKANYTRYADDLVFSFNNKKDTGKIIFLITKLVESCGFEINKKKTKIQNIKNGRIIITGVGIDKKGVHPTRKTIKKIRAAKHQNNKSSLLGLEEWSKCKLPKNKVEKHLLNELNDEMGISDPFRSVHVMKLLRFHRPKSKHELVELISNHYIKECDCGVQSQGAIEDFGKNLYDAQLECWGKYQYSLKDCIQWEYNLFVIQSLKRSLIEEKALQVLTRKLTNYTIEEATGYWDEELKANLLIRVGNHVNCGIQIKPDTSYSYRRKDILNQNPNCGDKFVFYLFYDNNGTFLNIDRVVDEIIKL